MKRRSTLAILIGLIALSGAWAQGNGDRGAIGEDAEVWGGPMVTFTKADGADPDDPDNQDRITENVWLTRDNDGGQFYNIAVEDGPDQQASPEGTLWAVGTTNNLDGLEFEPFRAAVGRPKDIVGQALVMYSVADEVLVDVTITSWSQGKRGGFSYERSTPQ